jgi:glutathione S-transferase
VGLALAAMEKAVQRVYEDGLRPSEKRHEPWVARVMGQLQAAFAGLEAEFARQPPAVGGDTIGQPGISAAVAWDFTQRMLPQALAPLQHPALVAFSAAAEALPAFRAAPFGDGRVQPLG